MGLGLGLGLSSFVLVDVLLLFLRWEVGSGDRNCCAPLLCFFSVPKGRKEGMKAGGGGGGGGGRSRPAVCARERRTARQSWCNLEPRP